MYVYIQDTRMPAFVRLKNTFITGHPQQQQARKGAGGREGAECLLAIHKKQLWRMRFSVPMALPRDSARSSELDVTCADTKKEFMTVFATTVAERTNAGRKHPYL